MILRVQNFLMIALFALFSLFWAQSFVSPNPISGGYQFFEEAASGDFTHNPLNALDKFAPSPKTAPDYANAPNSADDFMDGAGGVWNRENPLSVEYSPNGAIVGQWDAPLCGPASCSMVVSDSTGDVVDLGAITNQFDEIRPTGVSGNEMSGVLSQNGVSNEFVTGMNSSQLNSALDSGQPVIVNVQAGDGGHWLVVDSRVEINGQSYYNVRDPNTSGGVGGGYGVQTDYLISNWNGGNAIVIE